MKYTIDGHEVVVKQELKDGKFLVAFLYEETWGDESETIESNQPSVVDRVFDKPPQKKMEKSIREAKEEFDSLRQQTTELRSKRYQVETDIRKLKEDAKETLERLKKYRGLENIEDFIDGNFTFVLDTTYCWDLKIVPFDEYMKNSDQGMKLISLYGSSKGDLTFKTHQYSDGSGSQYSAFFFTTLKEAVEELQAFITEEVSKDNHRPRDEYVSLAKKYNLKLPEGYEKTLIDEKEEIRQKEISELKKQLEKLESGNE